MADVHGKATRSYNMSQIKSKDTKPEILVRKFLFANGYRYKLHDKTLPGKPDIVLPKYKTVIFISLCLLACSFCCIYICFHFVFNYVVINNAKLTRIFIIVNKKFIYLLTTQNRGKG